jgi:hypothetical protein
MDTLRRLRITTLSAGASCLNVAHSIATDMENIDHVIYEKIEQYFKKIADKFDLMKGPKVSSKLYWTRNRFQFLVNGFTRREVDGRGLTWYLDNPKAIPL